MRCITEEQFAYLRKVALKEPDAKRAIGHACQAGYLRMHNQI